MKKVFSIFSSVFLSLTILAVSGGFTLSKMTCLTSGHQTIAMSNQGYCCKNEITPFEKIRPICCAIFNQHLHVANFYSSFNKIDLKRHPVIFSIFSNETLTRSSNQFSAFDFSKIIHPPPVDAIDLLHYIHKLTV